MIVDRCCCNIFESKNLVKGCLRLVLLLLVRGADFASEEAVWCLWAW